MKRFLMGIFAAGSALFASSPPVSAAEVAVMISGGFSSSLRALVPSFEAVTGDHVTTVSGPSMGITSGAIPVRLARGEPGDVLILVSSALDDLMKDGRAVPGSKVNIALSPIGLAVRQGAPVPDISTVDKLRQVLLDAKSIAYSDSASGVYIQGEMFKKMGIEQEMLEKAFMVPATPVGEIVARGDAEIGFQQVSELLPVSGITFVGRIPPEIQLVTTYSAGLSAHSMEPMEGRKLIDWITSPRAAAVLERNGLQPPR